MEGTPIRIFTILANSAVVSGLPGCLPPVDHLKTEADFQYYLEADALKDVGDGSLIRAALNDIARAQQRNATP